MEYEEFPGGELVRPGLADLARGVESAEAYLVASFAPRLRRLGLRVPETGIPDPEHRLYRLLARVRPDSAHRRYNALIRRMAAFARAWASVTRA